MTLSIRPLTLEDRPAWAQLLAVCFDRPPDHMASLLTWLFQLGDMVAWGAWEESPSGEDCLIAQYACLLRPLVTPDAVYPVGMSMNMAVHPDHRGRGLIKQVSAPVYDAVKAAGGVMGLGFSNAAGVKVDRHSKGYGYQVVGQMRPSFHLLGGRTADGVTLHDHFPAAPLCLNAPISTGWHFAKSEAYLRARYGAHPFRRYHYGVWQEAGQVLGMVVYRRARLLGMPTAAVLEVVGSDSAELIARWSAAMRARGVWVAHLLSTPSAAVRRAFGATLAPAVARTPSYLTIKPLSDGLPAAAWSLGTWDFVGGDIL